MNKSVFSVLLVAVLGICSLNAGETISQKPATNLQKQDMEILFGANANVSDLNVAVLSEEEMKETKGEFWVFVAQTAGAWVLGKILDEIYDEIFK